MKSQIRDHVRRAIAGLLTVGGSLMLAGCGNTAAKKDDGSDNPSAAPVKAPPPVVTVMSVNGDKYVEHIDLPGASVRGMETTPLMAKVGGFVKEIRRVGYTTLKGPKVHRIQVSDSLDPKTGLVRNIVFRTVGASPEGKVFEYHASSLSDLEKKSPNLFKTYSDTSLLEIDVGSPVEAGTLLAVLDIPEMHDDVTKQKAEVERGEAVVKQKQAAETVADATVLQREAEVRKAKAMVKHATEEKKKADKKLVRIRRLVTQQGGGEAALLEEAEFEAGAGAAAVISANEEVKSASSRVAVARALVTKAKQDVVAAKSDVAVQQAALKRLETMVKYAQIRAPFRGTITHRKIDHGALVRPATNNSGAMPLFEITRLDKVRVVIPVPGRKSFKIRPGQKAVFHTIGGLPGVTVKGTITRSANTLGSQSRMLRIEMYLDNPITNAKLTRNGRKWEPRPKTGKNGPETWTLRPGMFGTVTLVNNWKNLKTVPTTAVARADGQTYVYEVIEGKGGKATVARRQVTVIVNDAKTVGIVGEFGQGGKDCDRQRELTEGRADRRREFQSNTRGSSGVLQYFAHLR